MWKYNLSYRRRILHEKELREFTRSIPSVSKNNHNAKEQVSNIDFNFQSISSRRGLDSHLTPEELEELCEAKDVTLVIVAEVLEELLNATVT